MHRNERYQKEPYGGEKGQAQHYYQPYARTYRFKGWWPLEPGERKWFGSLHNAHEIGFVFRKRGGYVVYSPKRSDQKKRLDRIPVDVDEGFDDRFPVAQYHETLAEGYEWAPVSFSVEAAIGYGAHYKLETAPDGGNSLVSR